MQDVKDESYQQGPGAPWEQQQSPVVGTPGYYPVQEGTPAKKVCCGCTKAAALISALVALILLILIGTGLGVGLGVGLSNDDSSPSPPPPVPSPPPPVRHPPPPGILPTVSPTATESPTIAPATPTAAPSPVPSTPTAAPSEIPGPSPTPSSSPTPTPSAQASGAFAGACTSSSQCDSDANLECDSATGSCLVAKGYPCFVDSDCSGETCSSTFLCGTVDATATFLPPYGINTICTADSQCAGPLVCELYPGGSDLVCIVPKSYPCAANGDCTTSSCVAQDENAVTGICA